VLSFTWVEPYLYSPYIPSWCRHGKINVTQNKFLSFVIAVTLIIVPSDEVALCNETDLNGACEIDYRFPPPFSCCIRNLGHWEAIGRLEEWPWETCECNRVLNRNRTVSCEAFSLHLNRRVEISNVPSTVGMLRHVVSYYFNLNLTRVVHPVRQTKPWQPN